MNVQPTSLTSNVCIQQQQPTVDLIAQQNEQINLIPSVQQSQLQLPHIPQQQQQQQQLSQLEITGVSRSSQAAAKESNRFRIVKTDSDKKSDSADESIQVIPIVNTNFIQVQTNDPSASIPSTTVSTNTAVSVAASTSTNNNPNCNNNIINSNNPSTNLTNGHLADLTNPLNLVNNYQRGRWFVADYTPENLGQKPPPQPATQTIPNNVLLTQSLVQQTTTLSNEPNSSVNSLDQTKLLVNNNNIPPSNLLNQSQPAPPTSQAQISTQNTPNNFYQPNQVYQQSQQQQQGTNNYPQPTNQIINQNVPVIIQTSTPQSQAPPQQANPSPIISQTNSNTASYVNIQQQQAQQVPAPQTSTQINLLQQQDYLIKPQQTIPSVTQSQAPTLSSKIQIISTLPTTNTDNTQAYPNYTTNVTNLPTQPIINIQLANQQPQQSLSIDNLSIATASNNNSINTSTASTSSNPQIPNQSSPKDQHQQQVNKTIPQPQPAATVQQQQTSQSSSLLATSLNLSTISSNNNDHIQSTTSSTSIDIIPTELIPDLDSDRKSQSDSGIHDRIEQAMDLVKSHLASAVKGEIVSLKKQINQLEEKCNRLEQENNILKQHMPTETLRLLESKGLIENKSQVASSAAQQTILNTNVNVLPSISAMSENGDSRSSHDSMISSFTEHVVNNNEIFSNLPVTASSLVVEEDNNSKKMVQSINDLI